MLSHGPLGRLRPLVSTKLGLCGRCIRLAGRAATLSWVAVVAVIVVGVKGLFAVPVFVVAGAFTVLLAAHVVAYTVRVLRIRRSLSVQVSPDAEFEPLLLGRREFFQLGVGAAGGALLFALSARSALAQQVTCPGTYAITLSGPNVCKKEQASKPTQTAVDIACATLCASKNAGCTSPAICILSSDNETKCDTDRSDNPDCGPHGKGWQTTCTYACVCVCH